MRWLVVMGDARAATERAEKGEERARECEFGSDVTS